MTYDELLAENARLAAQLSEARETCAAMVDGGAYIHDFDEMLNQVRVVELDRAQAAVQGAIPSLAKLMFMLFIKEDGTLWNYLNWDIGGTPEGGLLRLTLQRLEGKTAAELYQETKAALFAAQADAAALRVERDELRTTIVRMRKGGHELPASLFRASLEWDDDGEKA